MEKVIVVTDLHMNLQTMCAVEKSARVLSENRPPDNRDFIRNTKSIGRALYL